MERLMSHFNCTWWSSFLSSTGKKTVAPAGTVANPTGSASVVAFRSAWVQMVDVTVIKDALAAASFSSSNLYKMADIGDQVPVSNLSHLHKKSLYAVLALLMLVCEREPEFINILLEMISSPILLPAGRSSIVGGIVQAGRRSGLGKDTAGAPAGASQDKQERGGGASGGGGNVAGGGGAAVIDGSGAAEAAANGRIADAAGGDADATGSGWGRGESGDASSGEDERTAGGLAAAAVSVIGTAAAGGVSASGTDGGDGERAPGEQVAATGATQ